MKKIGCFLGLGLFILCLPEVAFAQNPAVVSLIKNATVLPEVSPAIMRQVFQATRQQFSGPLIALKTVPHSIVQIARPIRTQPYQPSTLGSGFLLKSHGKLWVAGAYHVMGGVGSSRLVRMRDTKGNIREQEITVTVSGISGWHSPDISLAEIPSEMVAEGMTPLEIAAPDLSKPAYSFGYTAGVLSPEDFLAVGRQIYNVQGYGIMTTFQIPGSSWENPVTGNGFCGSPIVQQTGTDGAWKAVGLHDGHCIDLDEPALGRGSGVNLSRVVPYMLDDYFHGNVHPSRSLTFRGWEVTRLRFLERVEKIQIWRGEKKIWERLLKNYPNPYSDDFTEQALENFDVRRDDKIIFHIARPRIQAQRPVRYDILFTVP